ncbi:alpha/beta fold hydrolase [Neorhizobium lilium]|uniref:Alpha/beta fold hydrolase n=1 Tax=Neorhizobium lilium TaxID=2503024 RepID=A0A3S3RY44_9HYPH|nr:alpha/beta hydrolase [Neorhizobium lilium]RWX81282.1 alpha/beta fold hydrolase [Neorhizobium lilium]
MPFHVAPDGCRVHYETFGDRGPKILLTPGLGGDGRFWTGVVRELEHEFRLVVVDHRGAGRSDRPASGYSIGQISADVAGIVAQEGGPMHVVGHSTGGAIAQTLALDYPDSGVSYTISSSWARADERFRTVFLARAALLDAGLAEAYQRLTHVFGHEAVYLELHAESLEAAVAAANTALAPFKVTAARVRMLLEHDRLDDLKHIAAPVQVIAAEGDILTPPELSHIIAAAIARAVLTTLPGAHFHPQARPVQFADVIRRFVTEVTHDS